MGGFGALVAKYSMKLISLSLFSLYTRLAIFITAILSRIFLGTRLQLKLFIYASVAIFGITLNVEPGWYGIQVEKPKIGPEPEKIDTHHANIDGLFNGTSAEWFGLFLLTLFVINQSSVRIVLTYAAKNFKLNPLQNMFWMHLGLLPLASIFCLGDPLIFHQEEIINYVLITLCGCGYQYSLFMASKLEENPTVVILIQNLLIVYSFLMDVFYFGKEVHLWNIIGSVLVFFSAVMALIDKNKAPAKEVKQEEDEEKELSQG